MELLPCPFCGGEALPTAHLTYNWFAPVCGRCNARGPSVKIERDSDPQEMRNLMNQADENWNRRASPASAPEGWKIVPVEPTGEMVDAGIRSLGTADKFRAMLAAAPTPPVSEDRKDAERYLWLRASDFDIFGSPHAIHLSGKELDQAIDAAMYGDKT